MPSSQRDCKLNQELLVAEVTQVAWHGELPSELEAIFRRGPDFETGHEQIVLLQLKVQFFAVHLLVCPWCLCSGTLAHCCALHTGSRR